jgi:hypothetical protein
MAGNLLIGLEGKKSRGFKNEIDKIVKEVYGC